MAVAPGSAGALIVAKEALDGLTVMGVMPVVLAAAALTFWVIALARGGGRAPRSVLAMTLGALGPSVSALLFGFGLDRASAGNGSLVGAFALLLAVVLQLAFGSRRLGGMLGLVVGVPGLWLVAGTPVSLAGQAGSLLIVAGALVVAVHCTVSRRLFGTGADQILAQAIVFTVAVIVLAPRVGAQYLVRPLSHPGAAPHWAAAIAAGVIFALALCVWAVGPCKGAWWWALVPMMPLVPLVSLVAAMTRTGQAPTLGQLAGAVLMSAIGGMALHAPGPACRAVAPAVGRRLPVESKPDVGTQTSLWELRLRVAEFVVAIDDAFSSPGRAPDAPLECPVHGPLTWHSEDRMAGAPVLGNDSPARGQADAAAPAALSS
jgi:drug/metabolite transporter (DMT)-like permease